MKSLETQNRKTDEERNQGPTDDRSISVSVGISTGPSGVTRHARIGSPVQCARSQSPSECSKTITSVDGLHQFGNQRRNVRPMEEGSRNGGITNTRMSECEIAVSNGPRSVPHNGRFLRHRFSPKPKVVATQNSLPKRNHIAKEAVSAALQTKTRQRSERRRKPNGAPRTKPRPCVKTMLGGTELPIRPQSPRDSDARRPAKVRRQIP